MKFGNPFYVAVLIVGVLFAITACAYGVMTVVRLEPTRALTTPGGAANGPENGQASGYEGTARPGPELQEHPLIEYLDQQGFATLMIELAVLAVVTVLAIGTDEFWERRAAQRQARTEPVAAAGDAASAEGSAGTEGSTSTEGS